MCSCLAEMTWPDVANAVANGSTAVILPLGATEQHGPHLPLGTDTLLAAALAEELCNSSREALVAPVLPIGCSDEHSGFSGLLSLDAETLARVIVDCARRLVSWGIRRLILLSAHGGNGQALTLANEQLNREFPALEVDVLGATSAMSDTVLAIARDDGVPAEAVGIHAGEGETSAMLALHPELVRMERAAPGFTGDMPGVVPRLIKSGLREVTQNGVLGDPRAALSGRGQRYIAAQLSVYKKQLAEKST